MGRRRRWMRRKAATADSKILPIGPSHSAVNLRAVDSTSLSPPPPQVQNFGAGGTAAPSPAQTLSQPAVSGSSGGAASGQPTRCIPYRIRDTKKSHLIDDITLDDLEILLISSQKSTRLMFPKGGWELDEDIELAASRETLEEAGVVGLLGEKLGEWVFKSKSQEKYHEGSMFPLYVTEELEVWPEKNLRHRVWMSVNEAREACAAVWMKEALQEFVCWFRSRSRGVEEEEEEEEETLASCILALCGSDDLNFTIGAQTTDNEVNCYLIS